jgi:hypothetical protein
MSDDRTVHACTEDGREIVRYDRSGKWYVEQFGLPTRPRRHVDLGEAARLATLSGSEVRFGLPGGSRFDAAVNSRRRR